MIGGLFGIEGGHCLEGDINNLTLEYDAGVRMLCPAHLFDNEMGGSVHGIDKDGLISFGLDVIQEMESEA